MARWSLEVLSTRSQDRARWRRHLDALPPDKRDVYYLPEYSALYEAVYGEPAFLFRYGDDQDQALMVAAERSVVELPFYQPGNGLSMPVYCDLVTPYGYGGPILHSKDKLGEVELFKSFREAIHQYCLDNGIVAEFLRLHPLMQNHEHFGQDPGLHQKNGTVWIDLRNSEEDIFRGLSKDHRRNVGKASRKGVEIVQSDLGLESVKRFHRLYTGAMERLGALPLYFFPLEFFQQAASTLKGHISCFFATWQGEDISGHLVLHSGPYINNFLSGSDKEYWNLKPDVLITYRIALWAKAQGYQFFHLGGGHAVQQDSVFKFKNGFSANVAPYYMYRCVHDQDTYAALVQMKQGFDEINRADATTADERDPVLEDYFPAYRA